MKNLKISDMKTVEISIDPLGKIFFYDNRVFRAINTTSLDQVRDMFECGLIKEITRQNLFPKTWISDISIEGYPLVLEHEKITHWNYPYEWSFDMLKDAGIVVLEINKIANKYGYQIVDAHAFNMVFNMSMPQYIDFGSFVKYNKTTKSSWDSYEIFYNHFYIPLYLWSRGYSDIARNIFLMRDYFSEKEFLKLKYPILNLFSNKYIFKIMKKTKTLSLVSETQIKNKINNKIKQKIALFLNKVFKNNFSFEKLEKDIMRFQKPNEDSMWNDYHDNIYPKTNKRFIRIIEIINTFDDAKSLIELASNQGKFSSFVLDNTHIEELVATDYDKEAVNIMYLNNKDRTNFLPLLFDIIRTNGRKSDEYIYDRIKCDIVMALAVTHHLLLTQSIPIEYILNTMKRLTNKYIIVEFMPMGLYGGDIDNIPDLPNFYTLSWFKENFINHFDLILDEKLEINRHVFIGKLKKKG